MYYLDPRVESLYRIYDQNEREAYLRLDLNENPGGLPSSVLENTLRQITPELIAQYPETQPFKETLANYLGTDPSHLCLTNGSAEAVRYVIRAFTSEGGRMVGVFPSFVMFQVYAELYGRNLVQIPYEEDLHMDINRILAAMTEDTQLLILVNPNNPMGNVYTEDEFRTLLSEAERKQITVLVDEAYHYFCPETFLRYALERENVLVTRTFSKLFSMAGCRLGYVAGWPRGVEMVQKLCTPHNINVFALRLAQTVLETPGLTEQLIRDFQQGREYLMQKLDQNGYQYRIGAGNFSFIQPHTSAKELVEQMRVKKKILIKAYPNVGVLGDCLRVTIGAKPYMSRFVEALLDLDR